MIRRALQTLLVLVLALGLVPGLSALVEQAASFAHPGATTHAVEGASDRVERGCGTAQHACGCHPSSSVTAISLMVEQPCFLEGLPWAIPGRAVSDAATDHPRPTEPLAPLIWAAAPPTPPPNATV